MSIFLDKCFWTFNQDYFLYRGNIHVEVRNGHPTYTCSNCDFQSESREEIQEHLDSSAEMPDVQKLFTMDVDEAIAYALRFKNW